MAGKLYMVPTPVGNLEDMTPRAVKVLSEVSLILAEDTRTSAVLMKHYGITTPMRSHHKFNEHETVKQVVDMLEAGETIALVTDAGTPGISDPGFMLSRECRHRGVEVETLPGATAFVPAIVNSGLPCERFTFEGFLPAKKGRATRLEQLAQEQRTMIFYESKHRLLDTLKAMITVFGTDREIVLARELTKMWEEIIKTNTLELLKFLQNNPNRIKGEFVLLVAGIVPNKNEISDKAIALLTDLLQDLPVKKAVALTSKAFDLNKNQIYQLALEIKI